MNTNLVLTAAVCTAWLAASPAHAGGRVHWSVTVGSSGYVVPAPGVVVSPQPHYSYGPPPSAFAPPPAVVYVQPAYPVYPPPVLYVDPYGRPLQQRYGHGHRHRHHHHGGDDWDDRGRGGRWHHHR